VVSLATWRAILARWGFPRGDSGGNSSAVEFSKRHIRKRKNKTLTCFRLASICVPNWFINPTPKPIWHVNHLRNQLSRHTCSLSRKISFLPGAKTHVSGTAWTFNLPNMCTHTNNTAPPTAHFLPLKAEAPATRAKTANAVFMFDVWREGRRGSRSRVGLHRRCLGPSASKEKKRVYTSYSYHVGGPSGGQIPRSLWRIEGVGTVVNNINGWDRIFSPRMRFDNTGYYCWFTTIIEKNWTHALLSINTLSGPPSTGTIVAYVRKINKK